MPFIPINLNEVKEAKPVPAGLYDLVITDCEEAKSKNGFPQFVVTMGIEGHEDAPALRHYASIPSPDDEPQKIQGKMLFLQRFLIMFGIKVGADGFDTAAVAQEMVGARARGELTLSEPSDDGTVYNRLVTPKLKEEGLSGSAAGRKSPPPPKR